MSRILPAGQEVKRLTRPGRAYNEPMNIKKLTESPSHVELAQEVFNTKSKGVGRLGLAAAGAIAAAGVVASLGENEIHSQARQMRLEGVVQQTEAVVAEKRAALTEAERKAALARETLDAFLLERAQKKSRGALDPLPGH